MALKGQAIYDLSGQRNASFKFLVRGRVTTTWQFYAATVQHDDCERFPPNTHGVLYYHVDPHLPPISGEIRFRLCDSLQSFDEGDDLRGSWKNPRPWSMSLMRLIHAKPNPVLVRYLVETGVVRKDLIYDLQKLVVGGVDFTGQSLYDLSQPFIIDFEQHLMTFYLITRTSFGVAKFWSPMWASISPTYSGLVKVRLELSTLPEHDKQGPTLVLRVLDFPIPPQQLVETVSSQCILPQSGSLFMRKSTESGCLEPWAYPLNVRSAGPQWKQFLDHFQKEESNG